MNTYNYCERTLFLSDDQKNEINNDLNEFFEKVSNEIKKHNVEYNLYLTGSLARGEPSVKIDTEGKCKLNSDIDFVVMCKSNFRENSWLMEITDEINAMFPEFESSFVLTDAEHIGETKAFIGRDLFLSSKRPIVKMLDDVEIDNVVLCPYNYLEAFVNVLSCYFLHPNETGDKSDSIIYKEQSRFYVKAVLEGLRLQFFDGKDNIIAYTQLYYSRDSSRLNKIISAEEISQFLYAREMFNSQRLPSINIVEFVQNALKNFYELYKGKDVFTCITQAVGDSLNIIEAYRYSIICYIMSLNQENYISDKYIKTMLKIIELCNEGKEIIQNVKSDFNYNINEAVGRKHVIELLRIFRLKYLRCNHYKNTGIKEIPDLMQRNRG